MSLDDRSIRPAARLNDRAAGARPAGAAAGPLCGRRRVSGEQNKTLYHSILDNPTAVIETILFPKLSRFLKSQTLDRSFVKLELV